jgi:hypothetical protein
MWTGDFFVIDLLADCEISQSEEVNVGIVGIIALQYLVVSNAVFQGAP